MYSMTITVSRYVENNKQSYVISVFIVAYCFPHFLFFVAV